MEEILPEYSELVELERETLKLLHDYLCQWEVFSHSAGEVQRSLYQNCRSHFLFDLHWDVDDLGKSWRIFLGAELHKNDCDATVERTSHCICVVEGRCPPSRVLRKFHFDYVTDRSDRRIMHPRFHLQYCGGVPQEVCPPLVHSETPPTQLIYPLSLSPSLLRPSHTLPEGNASLRIRGLPKKVGDSISSPLARYPPPAGPMYSRAITTLSK